MPPSHVPLSVARKRVFESVFASTSLGNTVPTPLATPKIGFAAPGQSFGLATAAAVPQTSQSLTDETWPEQVNWDRAWHVATAFLSFSDIGFAALSLLDDVDDNHLQDLWGLSSPSQEAYDALNFLLAPNSPDRDLHSSLKEYDLVEWYCNEMRRHFLANFRTDILKILHGPDQSDILTKVVAYLYITQRIYYTRFLKYVMPKLDITEQEASFSKLRRGFHAVVAYSLPSSQTSALLAKEITSKAIIILGIEGGATGQSGTTDEYGAVNDSMDVDQLYSTSYREWRKEPSEAIRNKKMTDAEDVQVIIAREHLLSLLEGVQAVGLGGNKGQKVFATVMNAMMTEFIRASYSGQWDTPSLATQHLRLWVENIFARLVVEVLNVFKSPQSERRSEAHLDVRLSDVEKWQEIGIARLGALRTSELFDVIVEWDSSSGAIEDLKHYAHNPNARYSLANSFIATLNQRLLHPGASTVEILQLYISIIRAFNILDSKGVLLDRIARPIRRYLRDREDTVKVIVSGLLADTADTSPNTDTLAELSTELAKVHEQYFQSDSGELDWDDMNWIPDPIDAAPDYKKPKNSDVIGSLISLFESKETFVKELQNMLGERLLRRRTDFHREISVLELLKVRFGDGALQACEVMLRDVFDSKRVDSVIRNDQGLVKRQPPQEIVTSDRSTTNSETSERIPQLHAKILSRFFWPTLQGQSFRVPAEILALQQRYSFGFESLKPSRKLTWLNGLGQVTVELDLEDRAFTDEVTTWQASVIYAFQSPSTQPSMHPVTKTVTELCQQLEMSASLVRSACLFWVSKRILTETLRDTFRILEVLPNKEEHDSFGAANNINMDRPGNPPTVARAAAAANAAAAVAAKESADAATMEKMNLYWQFIVGMLTNQGAMPLQRIVMMLKIAVPGGFPYSNEDLREFLAGMVSQGRLEIASGGNYKIMPKH
ncbi:hypothetical protein V8E54_005449 [Elaphomyces granulatus]